MIRLFVLVCGLMALTACTPARIVGKTAIGTGQVVLGAADMVI